MRLFAIYKQLEVCILAKYITRRLIYMVLSLYLIVTATFFLMRLAPGNPFTSEKKLPPEIEAALNEHYGLNQPWYVQYGEYLGRIAQWDFGPSFKYKTRTVNDLINDGFPVSLALGSQAILIAVAIGVLLGVLAALYHNKWQDYGAMIVAVFGISVPSFIMASFLQYVFAIKLGILPVARWDSFMHTILPS